MGRLHTRYSPVRRSPPEVLPLDLHVLGLSLAFILSQDQTLRCKYRYSLAGNSQYRFRLSGFATIDGKAKT